MDWIQVIVLSIVQGISEFLPISSSAHLILTPKLLGWKDQGLAFDVAVHIGTLIAILYYFKDDIIPYIKDFFSSLKQRKTIGQSTVVWGVLVGTIPVGLAGLLFHDAIEQNLRSPLVIAFSTIFFGLVLLFADKKAGHKNLLHITLKIAFLIGIAQALALIPGTSRSGITISMALLLGFNRIASAKFSFLLSIPVIILAGGLESLKLINQGLDDDISILLSAVILSCLSAYICVKWLMKLLEKSTMLPFVIYRIILGIFLLITFI